MPKIESFFKDDIALLEIQLNVFTEVRILEVVEKFGKFYYEVTPVAGYGSMRVEHLKKKGETNGK